MVVGDQRMGVEDFNCNKPLANKHLESIAAFYAENSLNLSGARILILGATGFVGSWLTDALVYLSDKLNLEIELTLNSRRIEQVYASRGHSLPTTINLIGGDSSSLQISQSYTHIIYAATPTTARTRSHLFTKSEIGFINGMENIIKQVVHSESSPVFLNLSSGAIYSNINTRTPTGSILENYTQVKRKNEQTIASFREEGKLVGVNARLFAFYGPRLPINDHYAIGNFIRDALYNEKIIVHGTGRAIRSYLHASDLTAKCVYLLAKGVSGDFDIGSVTGRTIMNWANLVGTTFGVPVKVQNSSDFSENEYVAPEDLRIPIGPNEAQHESDLLIDWAEWLKSNFDAVEFS